MKSLNIFARGLLSFAFEGMHFARLCAYLRHHSPVAQIGYSIFVFDLSDEEINHALYGPPAELTREVCVAGY